MGFQRGNQFGERTRLFDNALRRAIAQNNGVKLRSAAEQLLTKAAEGEPWAISMLADRLDGKAQQNVEVRRGLSIDECTLEDLRERVATLLAGETVDVEAREVRQLS